MSLRMWSLPQYQQQLPAGFQRRKGLGGHRPWANHLTLAFLHLLNTYWSPVCALNYLSVGGDANHEIQGEIRLCQVLQPALAHGSHFGKLQTGQGHFVLCLASKPFVRNPSKKIKHNLFIAFQCLVPLWFQR